MLVTGKIASLAMFESCFYFLQFLVRIGEPKLGDGAKERIVRILSFAVDFGSSAGRRFYPAQPDSSLRVDAGARQPPPTFSLHCGRGQGPERRSSHLNSLLLFAARRRN